MDKVIFSLPKIAVNHEAFKKLTESSGVYIFYSKKIPIYIGKAINLKKRLQSYLLIGLLPKTEHLVREAD